MYPYPLSLTKPIILPFPVFADTFKKADKFLPRCSLGNQLVCPNLLTLKFPTVPKGQQTITVMQLLLIQPQLTKSCTVFSPPNMQGVLSNPFCTQDIKSLQSWTKVLTPRPCEIKNNL